MSGESDHGAQQSWEFKYTVVLWSRVEAEGAKFSVPSELCTPSQPPVACGLSTMWGNLIVSRSSSERNVHEDID